MENHSTFLRTLHWREIAQGNTRSPAAHAMPLPFIVAALAGIFIPLAMERMNRDPALGSSVLLTATTDSMGFFIFLGLATLILL